MKVSLVENRDELATATNPEKRPEMVRKLHRLICSCKGGRRQLRGSEDHGSTGGAGMTTERSVQEQATAVRAGMEQVAQAYAVEKDAHTAQGRSLDGIRDRLKQFMGLENIDELVDGETGYGVELGEPTRATTWDVEHMPDQLVVHLAKRGLLTVSTRAFDALRKAAGSPVLDDAERFRMTGEGSVRLTMRKP